MISKFIGRILMKIGDAINRAGKWMFYYNDRKQLKELVEAADIIAGGFPSNENDMKDMVIKAYVKRGGCEVQTGVFRRVGCQEE